MAAAMHYLGVTKHYSASSPPANHIWTITSDVLAEAMSFCDVFPRQLGSACSAGAFHTHGHLTSSSMFKFDLGFCLHYKPHYLAPCMRYSSSLVLPDGSYCLSMYQDEHVRLACIFRMSEKEFRQVERYVALNSRLEGCDPLGATLWVGNVSGRVSELPTRLEPTVLQRYCLSYLDLSDASNSSRNHKRLLACVHGSLFIHTSWTIDYEGVSLPKLVRFCQRLRTWGTDLIDLCIRNLALSSSSHRASMRKPIPMEAYRYYEAELYTNVSH